MFDQTVFLKISNVTKAPAPGEQCTDEGNFTDWRTGNPIPCHDGCAGSGN